MPKIPKTKGWGHVGCHIFYISDMRNKLVVACMFICSTVFGPIMWHLWIYSGSANANFYFAITLVYSTAEVRFPVPANYYIIHLMHEVIKVIIYLSPVG